MLSRKEKKEQIQSYEERYTKLEEFLSEQAAPDRYEIFPINTKEGGGDKMEDLEALIISDEISVVKNAFHINMLRAKNGLKRFHIVIIPRVRTLDNRPLSSSRIRDGEFFDDLELIY